MGSEGVLSLLSHAAARLTGVVPSWTIPAALLAGLLLGRLTRRRRHRAEPPPKRGRGLDLRDPHVQLEVVSRAAYRTTPLMNRSEHRLWKAVGQILAELRREGLGGHLLMAQVSLGEVLSAEGDGSREAHAAVNSERLDLAVFSPTGHLVLAIEHQGAGHYGERTFLRDAVKREALRRAGVPMIEVPEGWDLDGLRALIRSSGVTSRTIRCGAARASAGPTPDASPRVVPLR